MKMDQPTVVTHSHTIPQSSTSNNQQAQQQNHHQQQQHPPQPNQQQYHHSHLQHHQLYQQPQHLHYQQKQHHHQQHIMSQQFLQQQNQIQQHYHNHQYYSVQDSQYLVNDFKAELSPLINEDPFIQGYIDCAEEAIRYLIEVEGLHHDHPMIIGLRQYLQEQQRIAYIQFVMRTTLQLQGGFHTPKNSSVAAVEEPVERQEDHNEHAFSHNPSENNRGDIVAEDLNGGMSQSDKESLAAHLAEEIFSLLQNDTEYSDDEYVDESEDDFIDEGFDEEVVNVES